VLRESRMGIEAREKEVSKKSTEEGNSFLGGKVFGREGTSEKRNASIRENEARLLINYDREGPTVQEKGLGSAKQLRGSHSDSATQSQVKGNKRAGGRRRGPGLQQGSEQESQGDGMDSLEKEAQKSPS